MLHSVETRRVPVQRAVERDEIPYPYVRSRSRSCVGGDICGTTPAQRAHVNIATVAMRNSFLFNIVKNKG